jgi:antitoxin MazE
MYILGRRNRMATTKVRVTKWGNSNAVRLPKTVLEKAQISEGDELEIQVEKGRIALSPVSSKQTLENLVSRITPENAPGELDWGKPAGRERW